MYVVVKSGLSLPVILSPDAPLLEFRAQVSAFPLLAVSTVGQDRI
jgi:hypothetical protein